MAPVTVDRPRTDPTERSIPATRITKSSPMASTARTEVWTATFEMFAPVRNTGLRSVMTKTRSSRMMTGPSRMIDRLRRMDLSVAPPTWLPVTLSMKALMSLPFHGEGHVRIVVPTLSPPCNPAPETMLLECPSRVNGGSRDCPKTPSARDAAPQIRGGVLVEKQTGVRVAPEHGGRDAICDITFYGRGHGPCFVRARGEEQDLRGLEDGRHADRDRLLRRAVGLEVGRVHPAGALGELDDAGARVERRSWLVEAYVAVAPDAQHADVYATGLLYGRLIALALGLGVGGGSVGDEDPCRVGVDEPVEILLHVHVIAGPVIRRQPEILVEVEEGGLRERDSLSTVHLDEPPVHPERGGAGGQHKDRGRLFPQPAGDDVRCGRAHGLVVGVDARPHSSETTFLALGIWGAAMLNSVTPRSMSFGIISGSPAASPHTPTGMPAALAALQVLRIRARTAGWSAFWSRRSRSLPLSAARVYWTRSFVPIEKKADSLASSAAQSAAAGVSIITPVSTSPISTPSDSSSLRHSCSVSFAASNSPTSTTIGNMTFRLPLAAARRMARSCGSKSSGVSRLILIPRQPRKGFSSAAWSTPGRSLSPPTSSVRTMTGFSPNARATALYTSYCSSSEGKSSRSMNRNSVRKSPTPSAPHPSASSASDADPRFAATSMRRPSDVRASTCLYSSRAACSSASAADILSNVATVSSSGSVIAVPSLPSMATLLASRASSRAFPTPTTAGIPMERAMIATCEVLDPSAVTNPRANPALTRAVSEGARLRASTTEGVCIVAKPEALRPMSSAEIWPVTHVVGPCGHVLIHLGELCGVLLTDREHSRLGALEVPDALLDG